MKIAICDTSTLIRLYKGGVLNILGKLFDKVYLPQGVKEECLYPLFKDIKVGW